MIGRSDGIRPLFSKYTNFIKLKKFAYIICCPVIYFSMAGISRPIFKKLALLADVPRKAIPIDRLSFIRVREDADESVQNSYLLYYIQIQISLKINFVGNQICEGSSFSHGMSHPAPRLLETFVCPLSSREPVVAKLKRNM